MNLQQLINFVTVAQLEHYTRASEKLMVTQSSLSHSISELEKELNTKLFYRKGRDVKLTNGGLLFLEYAAKALETLDEGRQRLQDFMSPGKGNITLSYLSSLDQFIPYLIARYYEKTEKIEKKFQFYQLPSLDIRDRLLDGSVDLGFSTRYPSNELDSCIIGFHKTVLIVPNTHRLAKEGSVDLTEIKSEKLITYNKQCQIREYINDIFRKTGVDPEIVSETTHDNIIIGSVAAGFGIAVIPKPLAPLISNVKVLSIENDLPEREIHMVWAKGRFMPPAVECFRNFVAGSGMILNDCICALAAK